MYKENLNWMVSILLIVGGIFLTTSCLDNDYETPIQAHGDVLMRVFPEGDSLVYGLQFFTYSNTEMKSVKAYIEGSSNMLTLDSVNDPYTFAYTPHRSSYTTTKPESGHYLFDVTFESGRFTKVSDILYTQIVEPPVITNIKPELNNGRLTISWNRENNVNYYKLVLLNTAGDVLFETPLLDNIYSNYTVTAETHGWYDNHTFESGEEYKLIINAYLFEPMATSLDIQCIATNDLHSFVWE